MLADSPIFFLLAVGLHPPYARPIGALPRPVTAFTPTPALSTQAKISTLQGYAQGLQQNVDSNLVCKRNTLLIPCSAAVTFDIWGVGKLGSGCQGNYLQSFAGMQPLRIPGKAHTCFSSLLEFHDPTSIRTVNRTPLTTCRSLLHDFPTSSTAQKLRSYQGTPLFKTIQYESQS